MKNTALSIHSRAIVITLTIILAWLGIVQAKTPNVILLMSDDQGWGDVGFNGNRRVKTPNLDKMASSGVKFDRFYASSPLCSPTRGACLTGRHPFRFGVLAAHTGGLRVGEFTIAEMLQSKGYRTGFFGKWHLGWVRMEDEGSRGFFSPPSQHGFDHWFATTSAVPTWNPGITPKGWNKWGQREGGPWKGGHPYVLNGSQAPDDLSGDDSRIIMDRALEFISKDTSEPFFATIWFHAPHEPVVAGEKYLKMYPEEDALTQRYYGCITAMDEQIGRLRNELKRLDLAEDTVVFFCSDNGPADSLAKKGVASTGQFKGYKHKMYEGGLLVPACMEWPGKLPGNKTVKTRCSNVDFFPTIAALVDYQFSKSKQRPIDGVDLMPFIDGDKTDRDKDMFFAYRRLVRGVDGQAIIRGDYKLLREAKENNPKTLLFNLAEDPGETNDLYDQLPEIRKELKEAMRRLDESAQISRDGGDYHY